MELFNLKREKMAKISYVTEEGLKKLKDELKQLESVERPKISKQIADARDKGDLSENAEYDAAKEAQGMLEMRIQKLKNTIANSRVLDQSKIDTSTVQIMNKVKIKNKKNGAVMEYTIVSESEANLKEGKISVTSPIAKGLLGAKVGDEVEIQVPSGKIPFEIMDISI
jgi:transcription elongation factor GreA